MSEQSLDSAARDAGGERQKAVTDQHKENEMNEEMKKQIRWEIEKIINVAAALKTGCSTGASTGEVIAAAFVLNRMDLLPEMYSDVVEAWERLDDWQRYVKIIKQKYMHLIEERANELPF